jgi:acyl carrier protein
MTGETPMAGLQFTQSDLMDILVATAGLPEADRSDDPDAGFGDIGLDSLAFLQLQTELAERYGFEMADDQAELTFSEIVAVVAAQLNTKQVA